MNTVNFKTYSYRLKINFAPTSKKKLHLFSLPQSNRYQIISHLKINGKSFKIVKETKWKNKVLLINNNQSSITFSLKSQSIKTKINKNFSLKSYDKITVPKIYLAPNYFINGLDPKIKSLAKKIIGEEKNLYQILKKLYQFTLSYLTYGKPTDSLYPYQQALKEKTTDCGGFSTFLASLLQSQNIPCRLVVGFLLPNNFFKKIFSVLNLRYLMLDDLLIHAWLEVLLPNKSFFPLDPAIEWRRIKSLTKRKGGFGFIPADRLIVSFGCEHKIKIRNKIYCIDLLQKPIKISV